jgi:hypothetical protein
MANEKLKVMDEINRFTTPQKLNRCKYDLIIYGRTYESIVTNIMNREWVLKEIIKRANEIKIAKKVKYIFSYTVYLTEDGIISVLLDSKLDKDFINFLHG